MKYEKNEIFLQGTKENIITKNEKKSKIKYVDFLPPIFS
jgi:hypothetical protein